MEKRSLQSGNTFFPVIKGSLTRSPAVSFIENGVRIRAHRNECMNGVVKLRLFLKDRKDAMDFFKIKHKPFFLIRRSLLIFIRTAPHQYSKGSFRLSLMQRPDIMSMNL
jgi:hypothetical protein